MSKTKPTSDIISAYDAGQRVFGENYVQEFVKKAEELKESHPDIEWHFIGHLQSNKARMLARCLNLRMVESIDSRKLAKMLNKECGKVEERKSRPPLEVLVQVLAHNREGTKFGVTPEEGKEIA